MYFSAGAGIGVGDGSADGATIVTGSSEGAGETAGGATLPHPAVAASNSTANSRSVRFQIFSMDIGQF
ncbi:hypothetical protein SDC9_209145 [bioreactor metagenome]|uniref:Uncharacterized protein n=1 Tax=bioreactor metagenome TaxID=1076179 RepID=A0A645JCJ3_9ZZZZ